jgi:hypothetical protein
MAILKGDWVITDGEIGQVQMLNFNKGGWHLVNVPSLSFASLRYEGHMVKIDPAFSNLLTAVNNKESENG